jgi:hypothetical protein
MAFLPTLADMCVRSMRAVAAENGFSFRPNQMADRDGTSPCTSVSTYLARPVDPFPPIAKLPTYRQSVVPFLKADHLTHETF